MGIQTHVEYARLRFSKRFTQLQAILQIDVRDCVELGLRLHLFVSVVFVATKMSISPEVSYYITPPSICKVITRE